MTTLAQFFGTSTAMTMDSTSWTTGKVNSSDGVNVAGLSPIPDDIQITVDFVMPSGSPAAQKSVNVFIAVSEDGTHYSDNDLYSGSHNQQASLRSPTNFLGPFQIVAGTASITVYQSFSLLALIGFIPRKFGILCENQTNLTPTSLAASYTPITYTSS